MSQLDDLLQRTSRPGRFVEHRRFRLARDKAIEKQREFALRHPAQYVTELVQAAVFAGATWIAVDARPSSVLVAWVGGRTLAEEEVEDLLDYLFADRGDPEVRHLVQLAVGVNAALQRRPRVLRIESGDGTHSLRMDVDAKGRASGGQVEGDDAIAGTYLYAEFSRGWFTRFDTSTWTDEQSLIEERCLYTPVPILLNGRAPFGYRASRHIEVFGASTQHFFDDGDRRGVIALHDDVRAEQGFRIVVGGVWVTSLPLEDLADRPLVGVICDDHLRKTADHGDIVRDRRHAELLHAVQPHVTTMIRAQHPRYAPPRLPPLPAAEPPPASGPAKLEPEPLPESIPMLAPRGDATLASLGRGQTPLFYVVPGQRDALSVPETEPHRFPWRVLVLTEGQALTLTRQLGRAPHRLTAPADVAFVQRMLERGARSRRLEVPGPSTLEIQLHMEGPLPDWGHGREGLPWCIHDGERTLASGVVQGDRVHTVRRRDGRSVPPRALEQPLRLPRISLRIRQEGPDLGDDVLPRMVEAAWALAVPEHGEPDPTLLAELLGHAAMPQFLRDDTGVRVEADLPEGWPDALRHVPLAATEEGPLTLNEFLALMGTGQVRRLDATARAPLAVLEARFGMGHLVDEVLAGTPLFGVGWIGNRWVWLDGDAMWRIPAIERLCFVGATFAPRTHDDRWTELERPFPELVAAGRADGPDRPLEEGWRLLRSRLLILARDRSWASEAHGRPEPARAEAMGRIALLHLTRWLGLDDEPLFAPSDQGGLRSLATLRTHPAVRIAPRHGVEVTEPWTFLLTRDELAAVEAPEGPRLRYDDGPQVWASLARGDDGWLLRQEVRQVGLTGWLGLRLPHDPTSGVLVRTTDRLLALPDLEQRVPCHGLLQPARGTRTLPTAHVRSVRLAALRLYQSLVGLLRDRTDPERHEAARRYAFVYVWRAHQRGRLGGTARQLATLVDVLDAQGRVWGPLEQWLATPPDRRPAVDPVLTPAPLEHAPATASDDLTQGPLEGRLADALAMPDLQLYLPPESIGAHAAIARLDVGRSTAERVVLPLNEGHPLVRVARARPGPAREVLLLELARLAVGFLTPRGGPTDLPTVQQALVAQRLETA